MYLINQASFKNAITLENGITQTPAHTVSENGGINRETQPYSGINTVSRKSYGKKGNCPYGRKGTALNTKEFRSNPKLHTHRLDAVVNLETLDVEKTIKDLIQILNYQGYMRRDLDKERFKTTIIKERKGESLVISFGKEKRVYTIHITTHDTKRLELFRGYVREVLRQESYTVMLETYVRYHEKDEYRVSLAIDSLVREIGKRVMENRIPRKGVFDYYVKRGKIQYKTATVVLKTYRHKTYSKREITDPEYHPKLEQLTVVKPASTLTPIEELLKTYTPLIYTVAYTLNIKTIEGEYERQHTTLVESQIDRYIQRLMRGIMRKQRAEALLERQFSDKRLVVAKMLDKGLRPIDIARIMGYSKRYITRIITELVNQGIVIRVGRGRYKLNTKYKPAREITVKEVGGDLNDLIELIQENKRRIVRYNLNGTPYVDIDEGAITRYIFGALVVRGHDTKLRDGRTYMIGKHELEKIIKQILNTTLG